VGPTSFSAFLRVRGELLEIALKSIVLKFSWHFS
jgi:hypothetical protein